MTYSTEVLSDSPLAYWRFGEASGATVAADASGNGHNGTYSDSPILGGAGLLSSDTNTCMELDGAGVARGASAANAAWMQPGVVTVEAIIRPDDTSGDRTIASRRASGSSGSSAQSWSLLQSSGSVQFRVYVNASSTTGFVGSVAGSIVAGNTYHVVATFDGTTMRLYINGAEVSNAARSGTLNAGTRDLAIGFDPGATSTFRYDGKIDEFAIYGAALSAGRISAHYTAATATANTGTLAETFPPFDTELDARIQPDLDAIFPAFRYSGAAAVDTAAELDATFPPFEVDASGDLPDVAAGDLSVAFPSFRSSFTAETEDAIATVTTYDLNGRVRAGIAYVTTETAVSPLPAGLSRATRVDKALAYPTPTLVDGRPT